MQKHRSYRFPQNSRCQRPLRVILYARQILPRVLHEEPDRAFDFLIGMKALDTGATMASCVRASAKNF